MFKKLRLRKSGKSRNSSAADSEPPSSDPKPSTASQTLSERYPSPGSSFRAVDPTIERGRLPSSAVHHTPHGSYLSPHSAAETATRASPSPSGKNADLGLHLLHQPPRLAPLDIIFVHGVGGHSRLTWSKNHDPAMFWPQLWLPHEPSLGEARIFSFGYNSNFRPGISKSISNTGDFAKELLYEMKYGRDLDGDEYNVGSVPIVFVVHSMGGLVVKKAYLLGQNDHEYERIVRSISSVLFLATPHRGTDLAETLNRVLLASFQSPKPFLQELACNSLALEELNEQFRHVAPRLAVYSLYETLATSVGPKKLIVLEKESSILGYREEVSRSLHADHHDVCKYASTADSNYAAVRNVLISLVQRFRSKGAHAITNHQAEEVNKIRSVLGSYTNAEDDYKLNHQRWMPGTCDWILELPQTRLWLDDTKSNSKILWYTAPPGSGKSVLSSYLISHLRQSETSCQFFFFKDGDQTRRSLASFLRTIAHQIAMASSVFKRGLMDLSDDGLRMGNADPSLLWRKLFEELCFEIKLEHPLFWVIDALDESESPGALLSLLKSIAKSVTSVRVLLVSRGNDNLSNAVKKIADSIPVDILENTSHEQSLVDIRTLVRQEIKHIRGNSQFKESVERRIMARADGSFLWVRLVLEEIQECHTEEAIQETLEEIPSDMNRMYEHMEQGLVQRRRKADIRLCKTLLQYIVCAQRTLSLDELAQMLQPEYSGIIDLRRTIQDVCGQFVLVDNTDRVNVVHQTARDYLTQVSTSDIRVSLKEGNMGLFLKSMGFLCDPDLRSKNVQSQNTARSDAFVEVYAAKAWMYHLLESGSPSDISLDPLVKFLNSPAVLAWIQLLALERNLSLLVKASKALSMFAKNMRKMYSLKSPLLHRLTDLELLDQWNVDLLKVVGKFSSHLTVEPSAIYALIPPFCPEDSALHQQFYDPKNKELVVAGIANSSWNDNLAKWSLPQEHRAYKIECTHDLIAVLSSGRSVLIWNSHNFSELCALQHGEPIINMCLNNRGTKLVTHGLRTTKLWSLPSGYVTASVESPPDSKPMAMMFHKNDRVVSGSDDQAVRFIEVDDFASGWQELNASLLRESTQIDGTIVNSPIHMAFNGDGTQIGVSYRGFPLSAWSHRWKMHSQV